MSGTASPQGPAVDPQPPVTGLPLPRLPRWQPFEWIVALRFLREGRTQSMFIIGGVAIGVAVIVFMSALLAGLQANFLRRALTGQPHVQLLPPKEVVRPLRGDDAVQGAIVQAPLQRLKSIDQWQALALQIRALPRVVAVSPVVTGSALVVRGDASRAISAVGVEPGSYFRIVAVDDKLVAGHARLSSNDILVGSKLAADLGVRVGDKLRVTAAGGADFTLAIGGIFDLGNKAANNRTAYMALRTAQSLLGLLGGVTALDVTVDDPYAAERVAQRITADTGVQADSWIKTNAEFFVAVNAQQKRQHADPRFRGAVGGDGHCQRAGGVGGAALARDRHPAGHGRDAGAGAAPVSDPGWPARARRCGGGLGLERRRAAAVAAPDAQCRRQAAVSGEPGTGALCHRAGAGHGDRADRSVRARAARGTVRSRGGHPWLKPMPATPPTWPAPC